MSIGTIRSQTLGFATREPKPEVFFQQACQAFTEAQQVVGETTDRYYIFGGLVARLRFAGPALIPLLTPALAHLETTPTTDPALTICLWDSASTGTGGLPLPWTGNDYLEFGLINGFNTERIKTLHQYALHMIDLAQSKGVYWIPDARRVPYYHSITPLRTILHWWLNQHQRHIVHAAAVGLTEGGVLITGKGGAGKSMTALSCLSFGLKYVGDENCLVSVSPKPYAHSLYCSGTLEAKDVERIPALRPLLSNESKLHVEKAVYLLYDGYRENLCTGFPIKAVFVPWISGRRDTSLQRRSAAQTLLALAPGSLLQLPGAGRESLRLMADLVRRVPCYTLELGTELLQIPIVIEHFLRSQP